jgi:hypothetical protein
LQIKLKDEHRVKEEGEVKTLREQLHTLQNELAQMEKQK